MAKGSQTPALHNTAPTTSCLFSEKSVEESLSILNSSASHGIGDAAKRRSIYGLNKLELEEQKNVLLDFLGHFISDPLICLLFASAGISVLVGNFDDAFSIACAIFIVVSVGFVQEYRSEKSLQAMQDLMPQYCIVVRNGKDPEQIPATQLVPGDIIQLNVGDRVPADVRLIESIDLVCDESNLTGETNGVQKHHLHKPEEFTSTEFNPAFGRPITDRPTIAHMGSIVLSGHAKGVVVATAHKTEIGSVYTAMSEIKCPKTPLQISMSILGKQLSYASFVVIGAIIIIGLQQGRPLLEMFTIGVSLAVAAIPEGLPIIVTVTLAVGVLRMAKRHAIVRRLPSVETLGSVNVICSDKTGTLTLNRMTLTSIFTFAKPQLINLTEQSLETEVQNEKTLGLLFQAGCICNNAQAGINRSSSQSSAWIGQTTEVAILDAMAKAGLDDCRPMFTRLKESAFNSERKYMAVWAVSKQSEKRYAFVKGATERIIPLCNRKMDSNGKISPLSESDVKKIMVMEQMMAEKGLRVLACASGEHEDPDADTDSMNLVFLGLFGMHDPPRENVFKSIYKLRRSGIHVIMITGDSLATAVSIAKQLGIYLPEVRRDEEKPTGVLLGKDIEDLSELALREILPHSNVIARATPRHKMKIVKALQGSGNVVAMTGDGVNDAPALKLADIGISMGMHGSDVAKEASDMILTDDSFATIMEAIEEGKGIFNNIQNFISFQLSTSVAALSLITIATIFGYDNPINAMQILWINILMDGPLAQSLGVETVEKDILKRPIRPRNAKILNDFLLRRILLTSVCIIAGTFYTFVSELSDTGKVDRRDTTMTFTCFVFYDIFNALSCRSTTKSILEYGFFTNKMFNIAVSGSLIGQLLVIYYGPLQRVFQTEALSISDLFRLVVLTLPVFLVDEARKYYFRQKASRNAAFSNYSWESV